MDERSFRKANALVGNDPNAAGLEITIAGPTLQFSFAGRAALVGGGFTAELKKKPAAGGTDLVSDSGECTAEAFSFSPGDVLAIGASDGSGCRCYLALAGGIDVPEVFRKKKGEDSAP